MAFALDRAEWASQRTARPVPNSQYLNTSIACEEKKSSGVIDNERRVLTCSTLLPTITVAPLGPALWTIPCEDQHRQNCGALPPIVQTEDGHQIEVATKWTDDGDV